MTAAARHTIVVGLGFGDEGKGRVVDRLVAEATPGEPVAAVVRFNGGAQAGHNVVLPDRRHHTFAQFGAGTLRGVSTHLSRFMLVEPFALASEAAHLASLGVRDPLRLLSIDRRALLTTPLHGAANRAREIARGRARHGSCGVGIGETMAYAVDHPDDAPRVGDSEDPAALRRKLRRLSDHYAATLGPLDAPPIDDLLDAYGAFAASVRLVDDGELRRLAGRGRLVFEGAQGVLLDEWRGFHPYTTWSTTTFANALELLADIGQAGEASRIAVVRTYLTRHGAGPFPTEDPTLALQLPEPHNTTGRWQGTFRVGHLDLVALRYAVEACGGIDALAVTHVDRANVPGLRIADAYEVDGATIDRLPVGPFTDLDHQARLTALLERARPILRAPARPVVEELVSALGPGSVSTTAGPAEIARPRGSTPLARPGITGPDARRAAGAPLDPSDRQTARRRSLGATRDPSDNGRPVRRSLGAPGATTILAPPR